MYTLLSGLWKWWFQKDEYCILIIGIDNAGKTTLLEQLKRKYASKKYRGIPFERISPTVGMNIGQVELANKRLVLWDLGGQKELQTLWNKYFNECHGIVYVVDASDSKRLEESYSSFDEVLIDECLYGVPLLVLANKQDKENAIKAEGVKEIFNKSSAKIGKRDCMLQEVSALNDVGIEEGIEWILQCVIRNIHRPPREQHIT